MSRGFSGHGLAPDGAHGPWLFASAREGHHTVAAALVAWRRGDLMVTSGDLQGFVMTYGDLRGFHGDLWYLWWFKRIYGDFWWFLVTAGDSLIFIQLPGPEATHWPSPSPNQMACHRLILLTGTNTICWKTRQTCCRKYDLYIYIYMWYKDNMIWLGDLPINKCKKHNTTG